MQEHKPATNEFSSIEKIIDAALNLDACLSKPKRGDVKWEFEYRNRLLKFNTSFMPYCVEEFKGDLQQAVLDRNPKAIFLAGLLLQYKTKPDAVVNVRDAFVLYLNAAKLDFAPAQFYYFLFYQDDPETRKYLLSAATQGYGKAELCLANDYINKNEWDNAYPWLLKAQAKGYPRAIANLGFYYLHKREEDKAVGLLKQAAVAGDDTAMNVLGAYYVSNKDKDPKLAIKYWTEAAEEKDNADAMFNLGVHHKNEKNDHLAFYWWSKAALLKHEGAIDSLRQLLESKNAMAGKKQNQSPSLKHETKGVPSPDQKQGDQPKNNKKKQAKHAFSKDRLFKSAETKDSNPIHSLLNILHELEDKKRGGLMRKDFQALIHYCTQKDWDIKESDFNIDKLSVFFNKLKKVATDKNDPIAQLILGVLLFIGIGGMQANYPEALEWLALAKDNELPAAKYYIAKCYHFAGFKGMDKKTRNRTLNSLQELYHAAEKEGIPQATYMLGLLQQEIYRGREKEWDCIGKDKAWEYIAKAAKHGCHYAQEKLINLDPKQLKFFGNPRIEQSLHSIREELLRGSGRPMTHSTK